jgi:hypothetical protein
MVSTLYALNVIVCYLATHMLELHYLLRVEIFGFSPIDYVNRATPHKNANT